MSIHDDVEGDGPTVGEPAAGPAGVTGGRRRRGSHRAVSRPAGPPADAPNDGPEAGAPAQEATEPAAPPVDEPAVRQPVVLPVFQAAVTQTPAPRRRRSASRPAGPPVDPPAEPTPSPAPAVAEPPGDAPVAGDAGAETATPAADVTATAGGAGSDDRDPSPSNDATQVDDDESAGVPDDDASDDDAPDDGSPRSRRGRRRRGGRGRRRRGSDDGAADDEGGEPGDGQGGADEAADALDGDAGPTRQAEDDADGDNDGDVDSTEDDSSTDDDSSTEDDGEDDTATEDDGGSGSSRRRRRRRRRGGAPDGDDAGPEPAASSSSRRSRSRRSPGRDTSEGEVTAVKGSTRLEAKRQRRRDGRDGGRRPRVLSEAEFLARRESVERTMVVRAGDGRSQVAVLEDGVLVEHYAARRQQTSMIGNVHLGRVQNVLPSMEAAFVDIGRGRNAVLYAGEVDWDAAGLSGQAKKIESALKSGDPVLVQVSKDPIGHKGARLTSQVSLPGRYLVYVPNGSMTGISRKLPDTERSRLKSILKEVVPADAGVIVRTAAEGASEPELRRDVERLAAQWEEISARAKQVSPPTLLHGEPDLVIKVVRDVFNEDFTRLVVEGEEAWAAIEPYVASVAPDLAERVSRWDDAAAETSAKPSGGAFGHFRVDEQIAKALERKVWLPSGGSLVIDRTEAMTVVDVNTGRFTGSGGNLEETVTRNNLEAAEEIVRQLRLRDIGGIVVVDFIDMVLESNRELVLRRLVECLGRDRSKHQVAEVTSLGLVQMTRKRVGQGLLETFSEPCEHCAGRGVVVSGDLVAAGSAAAGGSGGHAGAAGHQQHAGGSRPGRSEQRPEGRAPDRAGQRTDQRPDTRGDHRAEQRTEHRVEQRGDQRTDAGESTPAPGAAQGAAPAARSREEAARDAVREAMNGIAMASLRVGSRHDLGTPATPSPEAAALLAALGGVGADERGEPGAPGPVDPDPSEPGPTEVVEVIQVVEVEETHGGTGDGTAPLPDRG